MKSKNTKCDHSLTPSCLAHLPLAADLEKHTSECELLEQAQLVRDSRWVVARGVGGRRAEAASSGVADALHVGRGGGHRNITIAKIYQMVRSQWANLVSVL